MTPQSCDTMVALPSATAHGQTLFAKNSDRPHSECQPLELHERADHGKGAVTRCQFVSFPQAATTWRHIGSRPWWCWGYEHGFNEHQVVIGNEALHSKLEPFKEGKLVGMELLRLGLERGRTAREAVGAMTALITGHGQGKFDNAAGVRTYDNGYIVADPKEAFVLETAGHHWAVKRVSGALGISNVYSVEADCESVSPGAEAFAVEHGWWKKGASFSFADAFTKDTREEGSGARRRRRSCAVLGGASGRIDARTMMAVLSDHSDASTPDEPFRTDINPGSGICVHHKGDGTGGNTAASLVADLCADGSRLPVYWCSFYSPCLSVFFPVFIEGRLPEVLGVGAENASEDSPWWTFHRLSHLVREDAAERVPFVRDQWKMLQKSLFLSAYQVAEEGRRLIAAGSVSEAEDMLAGYMQENVDTVLSTARELIEAFAGEITPAD